MHLGGYDHVVAGEAAGYECVTSSSNPPAEIEWKVEGHTGEDATDLLQVDRQDENTKK